MAPNWTCLLKKTSLAARQLSVVQFHDGSRGRWKLSGRTVPRNKTRIPASFSLVVRFLCTFFSWRYIKAAAPISFLISRVAVVKRGSGFYRYDYFVYIYIVYLVYIYICVCVYKEKLLTRYRLMAVLSVPLHARFTSCPNSHKALDIQRMKWAVSFHGATNSQTRRILHSGTVCVIQKLSLYISISRHTRNGTFFQVLISGNVY